MAFLKYRNLQTQNFEFYTDVPDNLIKRMSGRIVPTYFGPPHSFWINNPTFRMLPSGEKPPVVIFNILMPSYYIEGGLMYMDAETHGVGYLAKENFTWFRTSGNDWIPIQEIWLGNSCIVAEKPMVFSPISAQHFVDILWTGEVETLGLIKMPVTDLLDNIAVKEWAMY